MPREAVIGDKFLVTWEELGKPTSRTDVDIPGLGTVVLDEADIHYGQKTPGAAFFVRPSRPLGPGRYVVVSRVQPA